MSAIGQAILMTVFMAYSVAYLLFICHASRHGEPDGGRSPRSKLLVGALAIGLPLCLLVLLAGLLH